VIFNHSVWFNFFTLITVFNAGKGLDTVPLYGFALLVVPWMEENLSLVLSVEEEEDIGSRPD
jgi:hypothetical protein